MDDHTAARLTWHEIDISHLLRVGQGLRGAVSDTENVVCNVLFNLVLNLALMFHKRDTSWNRALLSTPDTIPISEPVL